MAYPHSIRIQGMLAKIESTYGTDAAPSASVDGVRGIGSIWNGINPEWAFENLREDTHSNSLIGVAPGTPKGRIVSFTYTVQLMGAGAQYSSSTPVRPECDPLVMSCGFARTHTDGGSASIDYDLADTGHASSTVWLYAGGKLWKLTGVRGNMTYRPQAGGLGEVQFDLMGFLSTTPTEVAVPDITYSTVVPPANVAMGLAVNPGSSWTPRTAEVTIATGHTLVRLDDVNGADGIEQFALSRTQPTCEFQARSVDLSDYSAWTLAASRTVQTIDMVLNSTVQWNRVAVDIDLAYLLTDPVPAEDQGFAAYRLPYGLRDLQFTFN